MLLSGTANRAYRICISRMGDGWQVFLLSEYNAMVSEIILSCLKNMTTSSISKSSASNLKLLVCLCICCSAT